MARAPKDPGGWILQEQIGKGGQSRVWRVTRGEGTPAAALKQLRLKDAKKTARFVREVRTHLVLSSQRAPHIVPIIDHNIDAVEAGEEWGYLVLPLAACSLHDVSSTLFGRLELCLEIFEGIVEGVAQAHLAQVVHRDLKPGNILFPDLTLKDPLVADFGICFVKSDSDRVTSVGETVGAKFFMAPEQERGGVIDVAPAADIYALGKLLGFMLTKRYVYREEIGSLFNPEQIAEDPRVAVVREKLLEQSVVQDPAGRLQDGTALLAMVREVRRLIKGPPGGPGGVRKTDPESLTSAFETSSKVISEGRSKELRLEFDGLKRDFDERWKIILESVKDHPGKSQDAAQALISSQEQASGLILAVARMDEDALYPDLKRFLESILDSSEGQAGYAAVSGIPHVLSGFLYMSASVMALTAQSWRVLKKLLVEKFKWHYQSTKPLYSHGFELPYFFHSEAFDRKSDKLHDFFRATLKDRFLGLLRVTQDRLTNRYVQTQMLMCLRAAQLIEQGQGSRVFADFGRFYSWRVEELLHEMEGDVDLANGVAAAFEETPSEFLERLNGRLKIVRSQMWSGAEYIWESLEEWRPHGPSAAADGK